VLNALIDGQDGEVAGAAEAAVVEDLLHRPQNPWTTIRVLPDAVDEVGAGKVKLVLRNRVAFVIEQVLGLVTEMLGNGSTGCLGHRKVGCFVRRTEEEVRVTARGRDATTT